MKKLKKGCYYLASYDASGVRFVVLFQLIHKYSSGNLEQVPIKARILYDSDTSVANWTGEEEKHLYINNDAKEIKPDMLLIEKMKLEKEMKK